jgi:iron complex transport system ATP-binding protein
MSLLRDQSVAGKAVFMCLHDLNLAARWCSHVLLLYPNGDACWGPADSMLKPSALEQLYNQKLVTVEADGAPVFVPVSPS